MLPQSIGADYLPPFTFNGVRCLVGGLALIPVALLPGRHHKTDQTERRNLLLGGLLCGILMFAASSLQQIGIQHTTAGKAGFITAFYIVIVPVLGNFLGQKNGRKVWIAVLLALVGLYFLCITETFSIQKGDIYIFLCALIFSLHILVIDYFSPKVSGVKLSCLQFLIAGVLSLPVMAAAERPQMSQILTGWQPILYAGLISCAGAYTLQIIGQRNMNPAIASLILSLESCFSVLAGWIILGEVLSKREAFGCVFMVAAILLAQLPDKKERQQILKEERLNHDS